MAAPERQFTSTGTTDAGGAWTHSGIAGAGTDCVVILQVLQDGANAGAVTLDSVTNMEDLAGTDGVMTSIGAFQVGGTSLAIQHLWIGRKTSTTASAFSGSNSSTDDLYIRAYGFLNVSTGTTLATVIENGTAGATVNSTGTSATAADAGVTTLDVDRLALNFLAINDDNAFAGFTGETGGTWIGLASYAESSGTDGAIYQCSATMASAGTINGGTGSITDSDAWGAVGFALIGTTAGSGTNANAGVATGTGAAL